MKISPAAALLGSVAMVTSATPVEASQAWYFHADHVLGTSLDVIAVAVQEHVAALAADIVQSEITRLDAVLSTWRTDSEIAALNASSSVNVSSDLFRVVQACEAWRAETAGAFSARLGALENAVSRGSLDLLSGLARKMNAATVRLDQASRHIEKPQGLAFAVDGLAKGYIIDRAMESASLLPGLAGLMVNIGGDIRVWGKAPGKEGWLIGVADAHNPADNAVPSAVVILANQAIATSGRLLRDHVIFDPQSGLAAVHVAQATAIAPIAADADALASALSVMTPQEGIALADRLPGVAAHIVDVAGQTHVSQGWRDVVVAQNVAPKKPAPDKPASGGTWPAGFTVKIEYELLPGFGGRRVRYPYVTIWITNAAGELVRALTYQADKYRYMRENYVFWNRYSDQVNLDAITKPTRPPGRYTLEWDGKDEKGRPVPQGKYTVNVESSREHGFHSMQRIELDIGTSPVSGEAPPQEDMGAIKASYGKTP